MGKRKTKEQFIEEANLLHDNKFDYSKIEYKNRNIPVKIICPIHGEFFQTPYDHLRTKHGCPNCQSNRRLDTNSFIDLSNKAHNNKYDYSKAEYVNKNTKVCIICPEHGEFWQKAEDHYNGHGCRKCYDKKFVENQTLSAEMFLQRAKDKFGNKYTYDLSNYQTLDSKIKITCPEHGVFEQVCHTHLNTNGCPRCGRLKANKNMSLTQEEFITRCKDIHSNKYNYSKVEYVKGRDKIIIICPEHGEFIMSASHHLHARQGCPKCVLKSQTKLLEKLKSVFPDENFVWEYTSQWLGRQRIDICLEKYKIGIEYDGIQHYFPVDYFGGQERFKNQIEEDAIKNQKCKENRFTLFRMKYDYTDEDFYELCIKIKEIILNYTKDEGGLINE